MSKIEEIINENFTIDPETGEYQFNLSDVKLIAYQYASWYAFKTLECAEEYLSLEENIELTPFVTGPEHE